MKHTRRGLFGLIGGAVSAALVAAGVKKPTPKEFVRVIRIFPSGTYYIMPWRNMGMKQAQRFLKLWHEAHDAGMVHIAYPEQIRGTRFGPPDGPYSGVSFGGEDIVWDPTLDEE